MTRAERLNLFFVGLFFVLLITHLDRIERSGPLVFQYLLVISAQLVLIKWKFLPERIYNPLREFIVPILSVLVVFDSITEIVPAVNPHDIDHLLVRLDYLIFGTYPTVWMERFYNPYLTDLLIIGYCTYYFMPIILGVVLKIKGKEEAFQEGLFTVLLCFYLSYVGYVLFPALGPRYTMLHLHNKPLQGALLFEGINNLLNTLERIKRDAFPSGHTGITLVVVYLAWKHERKLLWAFVPFTLLLLIATVYCRFHYGVDLLGGLVLTVLTLLGVRFFKGQSPFRPPEGETQKDDGHIP